MLDAEQEVLNAKLSVVEAERNLNAATFQLLTTLGVFDVEGIRLPVDEYDPNANFEAVRYKGMTEVVDRYVPDFLIEGAESLKDTGDAIVDDLESVAKAAQLDEAAKVAGKIAKQSVNIPKDIASFTKTGLDVLLMEQGSVQKPKEIPLGEIDTRERRELPAESVVTPLDSAIISDKERPDLISPKN